MTSKFLLGGLQISKKCRNLSQFARQGEGNSAPLEDLPRFRNELQQLIQSYPVENVFICDEIIVWILLKC